MKKRTRVADVLEAEQAAIRAKVDALPPLELKGRRRYDINALAFAHENRLRQVARESNVTLPTLQRIMGWLAEPEKPRTEAKTLERRPPRTLAPPRWMRPADLSTTLIPVADVARALHWPTRKARRVLQTEGVLTRRAGRWYTSHARLVEAPALDPLLCRLRSGYDPGGPVYISTAEASHLLRQPKSRTQRRIHERRHSNDEIQVLLGGKPYIVVDWLTDAQFYFRQIPTECDD